MNRTSMGSSYSTYFCGGPDVCSGCESFAHGVYEDGSGEPEALDAMRRAGREVRGGPCARFRRSQLPRRGLVTMETPCIQDGAVSLRIEDDVAQDFLWEYALRLRSSDPTFATQLASELLAAGFVVGPDVPCATCHGTGIIETGNNDLPCACPVGSFARFNVTTPSA